jgi:pimeloyl-ACP methyl ester carboxylesterase
VRHAVYVDSGPLPDGGATRPDLDPSLSEFPLPSWEEFEHSGTSLAGLDSNDLDQFRRRAVPHPAGPAREPLRLKDPARLSVPVTLVASSFRPDDICQLAAAGHPFFAELPHVNYTISDLPTGHWPMWSRPDDLAGALIDASAK